MLNLIANVPPLLAEWWFSVDAAVHVSSGTWMAPVLERHREQLAASPAYDASMPDQTMY